MTADTSAVIAALSAWHERHEPAAAALADVVSLPAHVVIEAYSVLTRLPAGLAVTPALAAGVLSRRFPRSPLRLDEEDRAGVVATLANAGVLGGATYDGLVGLEARSHGETLLTLDERAQITYRRLSVPFSAIGLS